ncbi:hypothetical protein QYM36_010572, partial [Artemia franciscana]
MHALELKHFDVVVQHVDRESEDIGEVYHLIYFDSDQLLTIGLSYKQISDRILMAQVQHKHE